MRKLDYKWLALGLLWVAFFLQQGMRQIYGPLVGSIQASTGATDVQLGLVSTVFTLMYGLSIPFAGFAADLFSRKWMVTVGVAIFSLGILTSGFVTAIGALVVTYGLVNGLGQPFYYPSSTSLVSQLHVESKATALSILQLGMYVGVIGCGWLAGWFAGLGAEGWRLPFKVLGVLGLVWAAVLAFFLKDTQPAASDVARVTIGEALKAMFSKPAAVLIALALGTEVYVDVGFKTWMPDYLSTHFDVSRSVAGLNAVLWHYLGAALGILVGSRLGDRLVARRPQVRIEIIGGGLLLAIPFIFWMAHAQTFATCCVAMGLFGFFRGVYDSNNFAAFFDVVAPRFHASAAGFNLMIAFVIGCFSPTVLGWTKSHYSMSVGLASLGAVYFVGVLLLWRARSVRSAGLASS